MAKRGTANMATGLVGLELVAYQTPAAFEAALARALCSAARAKSVT